MEELKKKARNLAETVIFHGGGRIYLYNGEIEFSPDNTTFGTAEPVYNGKAEIIIENDELREKALEFERIESGISCNYCSDWQYGEEERFDCGIYDEDEDLIDTDPKEMQRCEDKRNALINKMQEEEIEGLINMIYDEIYRRLKNLS